MKGEFASLLPEPVPDIFSPIRDVGDKCQGLTNQAVRLCQSFDDLTTRLSLPKSERSTEVRTGRGGCGGSDLPIVQRLHDSTELAEV